MGGKGSSYAHGLFIHTEEGRKDGNRGRRLLDVMVEHEEMLF